MAEDKKILARKELARRELARRQGKISGSPQAALAGAQEIGQAPGLGERIVGKVGAALPIAGQTVGGIAGSIIGGTKGMPARGGAVGGTLGRTIGRTQQEFIKQFRKDPLNAISNQLVGGPLFGPIIGMNNAERKALGKEVLKTAGVETLLAGATAGVSGAAKGALEALLGPRVAERGIKQGFKRFLDPKFYQDRVPKEIVTKTSQFFKKLNKVTGEKVRIAVEAATKKKGASIGVRAIQKEAKTLLKETGADTIEDLGAATISKAQRNKLGQFMGMLDDIAEDKITPSKMWDVQKKMDKIRFRNQWDPDVRNYMDSVRALTSKAIKGSGDDVAETFGRYSSVKQMEKQLEAKFQATLIDGDTFSPATEQFANTLLGTSKDETVRGLRKLDSFLNNADDRIVEDLLDVAATESLSKTINFMGVVQRSIIGALGGQKGIAAGAAAAQSPGGRVLRGLINRGTAVGGVETFNK